jgi:Dolichyl-phosphate-mannose-protein mannosyltransferase
VSRRRAYAVVVAAAVAPRVVVLLHERGAVTRAFVDKGDDFARTFLAGGSYGFIPGHPSAYTQPLYGFFLVPLYWIFGRSWITVGTTHLLVAAATAVVVFEIGRRFVSDRVGLFAAVVATLEPYVVWHDMHMNREILDELLAALIVLVTLLVAERPTALRGAALGIVSGLAILGNVRLVLVPLILAAFVLACARRRALGAAVAVVLVAAAVLAPWLVRDRVSVGCWTLTTDGRALWKANNPATLRTLRSGKWIDAVPSIPGAPPTPQDAGAIYRETGKVVAVDECAQMRFYRSRALRFMRDNPGEKAKLAAVAARMVLQPSVTLTENRPGEGTFLDTARVWIEAAYMIVLYVLALIGVWLLPRRVAALAVALLAYDVLTAMVFAGETRYRVPWDFLLALAAAAAAVEIVGGVRSRRVASASA